LSLRILIIGAVIALAPMPAIVAAPAGGPPELLGEPREPEAVFSPGLSAKLEARGELLLGELACASCHRASKEVEERLFSRRPPFLGEVGSRATPAYLRAFLENPSGVKPGTLMPDLLHGLDTESKSRTVEELTHFLSSLKEKKPLGAVEADPFEIELGRTLYHQVGCVACHAPKEPPRAARAVPGADPALERLLSGEKPASEEKPSVPLGPLHRKTTVEALERFLLDPLKVRPSGRMPSLALKEPEARAIAMYLLREQLPGKDGSPPQPMPGLRYAYFEGNYHQTADLPVAEPRAAGRVASFTIQPRRRDDGFGFVFTGLIRLEEPGRYTFYLRSDDGSRLWIGERLVVDHDGVHSTSEKGGSMDLERGDHPIRVAYFEEAGDQTLEVLYEGPGIKKQPVPPKALFSLGQAMRPPDGEELALDRERVERGRERFTSLGCAGCHGLGEGRPVLESRLQARPLADLDLESKDGCLGESVRPGLPRFVLRKADRADLRAALKTLKGPSRPLEPGQRVERALAALDCLACHVRGGRGGPGPLRAAYFQPTVEADLGEEGRMPPVLDGVGAKLKQSWLRTVLLEGATVRPYLATRMPRFGESNVGWLSSLLPAADGEAGLAEEPKVASDLVPHGRSLVGTQGLSCITCHTYGSYPSLGIPGLDLAKITGRIRYDWFRRFLLEPRAIKTWTRMPQFWPEGQSVKREILEGDTERQIAAIWSFLSRGQDSRLPAGLKRVGMELVPEDEPIVYRNFIKGAGTRGIGVGYPGGVNLAFDANDLRWAMVWRGGFLDVSRHRSGRGEGFEPPLGKELSPLTEGAPFAFLPDEKAPWPRESGKKAGYRMGGYRLDGKRRPTFLYSFRGIAIEDSPLPSEREGAACFVRTLTLRSERPVEGLWFRAGSGRKIEEDGERSYRIDGRLRIGFEKGPGPKPIVRDSSQGRELLLALGITGGEIRLVEEIAW
jgi:mono/diheme cytochrome c family protein